MLGALKDKALTIRKAFAGAIGNVAKVASNNTMKRMIGKLKEYNEAMDNPELRVASSLTVLELCKRAPESLRPCYPEVVPLIFLGRNDPTEDVSKVQKSFPIL